jgi:hypothetical protein
MRGVDVASARALNGSRPLLLGLSKRDTGTAGSHRLRIVQQLTAMGAQVGLADPYVDDRWLDPQVVRVEGAAKERAAADAVVAHRRYVLDGRHRLRGDPVGRL